MIASKAAHSAHKLADYHRHHTGRVPAGIAPEVIQSIRVLSPLEQVAGEHVHLHRCGVELAGLCPFHNEKTPSFTVSRTKQLFHCHGCAAGGDVFEFVKRIRGCGFHRAVRFLADRAGIPLHGHSPSPQIAARVAEIRAEREQRQASERFCSERQQEVAGRCYALSRLAIQAERVLKHGCSQALEDFAWLAIARYTEYELYIERERPTDKDVMVRDWNEMWRFRAVS